MKKGISSWQEHKNSSDNMIENSRCCFPIIKARVLTHSLPPTGYA